MMAFIQSAGAEDVDSYKAHLLTRKLIEDLERQEAEYNALERSLRSHLDLISEKKRQLEIKKRSPIQCLVNLVSCWK